MKENTKKSYCTPVVEVLAARIEKGFELSPQQDEFTVGGETSWQTGNTNAWFT